MKKKSSFRKAKQQKPKVASPLKEIFDGMGLTRSQIAKDFGVTRDAIQRMIRSGSVSLQHLDKLQKYSTIPFECETDPSRMRAVSFKITRNHALEAHRADEIKRAGLMKMTDQSAAYRSAMLMRRDLLAYTDEQLIHELRSRGWTVIDKKPESP